MVQHYPAVNRPATPVCSVCIANYNGIAMLADCIDSVLDQWCDFSVEIIVHDDASTDDSLSLLRKRYPQVEVLASTQNVGFCISNNRMVAHARGEYILLLNNDAALFLDSLSTLMDMAKDEASSGILTLPQYDWNTGTLVDRGCMLDPFYNPIPNLDPERTEIAMAIGACLWIPRDLWNLLGGFPEWMESIAEDLYLCCFARSCGVTVRTATRSGFRHRLGSSFGGARIDGNRLKSSVRRRRLSERNKTFVLVIFTPTPGMWPLLVIHLLAILLEGSIISVIRMDHHIFRDIYANLPKALWSEWKTLHRLRRHVRRVRNISTRVYIRVFSPLPRKLLLVMRYGMPRITK